MTFTKYTLRNTAAWDLDGYDMGTKWYKYLPMPAVSSTTAVYTEQD